MAATNLLSATITSTDGNNNVPINRGLGNPSYVGVFGGFAQQSTSGLAGVDTPLPFPAGVIAILQLYIKNLAAPSGATLTVKWTPQGGALATVQVLQPGSMIIFWQVASAGTAGVTSVTVNGSANSTPFEVFVGA